MESNSKSRRAFLQKSGLLALAGVTAPLFSSSILKAAGLNTGDDNAKDVVNEFTLPPLPYATDALEPHIDKMTMEIHHDKHHGAYVTNLNKAVKEGAIVGSLDEIVKSASRYSPAVRNNGGGHWNHSFFWKIMKGGGGGAPGGKLADAINSTFGSLKGMQDKLNEASMKRFGSGFAWLVVTKEKKLEIGSTPNQDNPLMDLSDFKGMPVMGIDVWEHAYYLKYQNKRADYVAAWWNVVNWEEIAKNFDAANM